MIKNVESIGLEYVIKREDKKGDNTDDNNKDDNNNDDSKKKSKPIYDQPGMRFVFALFAFVFKYDCHLYSSYLYENNQCSQCL